VSGPLYGNGRRDACEPEVVKAFEEGGASVAKLSGNGLPDLLVGFMGHDHLVECKTGRAGLRTSQKSFAAVWRGGPPVVVRTAPQARRWLGVWRERYTSLSSVLRAQAQAGPWQGPEEDVS
jgi:hypothetical protein